MILPLAPHVSESDFTDAVIQLATLRGWRCAHFRPCRTDKGYRTLMQGHIGFPDLVMARNGVVIFAELKAEKGRMTAAQQQWVSALGNCYLWRPSDMDEIRRVLR